MSRRRRRGFIDVSRASGRSIVRRYQDPTVAQQIDRLKQVRNEQLGQLATRHVQEVQDLERRQSAERKSIWDTFYTAKEKLLEQTRAEVLA